MGSCHWQEGSVFLPISSPGVSAAAADTVTGAGAASAFKGATTTAVATKVKRRMNVNAIMEAVASGILFFIQPVYPHPVPYACSYPGYGRASTRQESCGGEAVVPKDKNANPNVPRLPPELYSIIAYHLHMDPSTTTTKNTLLNSCSLASSAWLTASRKYTFRTVKLTYTNVFKFLKLLEDPTCSFKCCVKRLEMREGEYAVDRWINDVVPRLVRDSGMQSVEVLEVYNLTWAELSPRAVISLTEGFTFSSQDEESEEKMMTTMKSLRVGTCYWECVHDFFGFVGSPSFAGLRTLVCDSVLLNCGMGLCRCSDVEEDLAETAVARANASRESAESKFPPALENLYLGSPEEKMLRWLVKEDAAHGLEKLGLVVRERMSMEFVGQLMGRATEVKELALDLPSGCALSLTNNTHLRSLRIHVDLSSFSSFSSLHSTSSLHTFSWLLDLISSITSPHIHLLILHLDVTVFSIGDFHFLWPWQDFINVINGLESMRRVVFLVTYSRRRAFNALKEMIRDMALDAFDAIGCKIKVRGVKYSYPDRRDSGSEVWTSWMED